MVRKHWLLSAVVLMTIIGCSGNSAEVRYNTALSTFKMEQERMLQAEQMKSLASQAMDALKADAANKFPADQRAGIEKMFKDTSVAYDEQLARLNRAKAALDDADKAMSAR